MKQLLYTTTNKMLKALQLRLQQPLPGKNAQVLMSPPMRTADLLAEDSTTHHKTAKLAAVLILFYYKNNDLHIAFIKRTTYDGVHSGQIAFPGGRYETSDPDLIYTALREAEEEVGVPRAQVEVLGKLTELYIPPSDFLILPVVGYTASVPNFIGQESEVADILEIPFKDFFDKKNRSSITVTPQKDLRFETPCFKVQNEIIWGATAMVMSELIEVSKDIEQSF